MLHMASSARRGLALMAAARGPLVAATVLAGAAPPGSCTATARSVSSSAAADLTLPPGGVLTQKYVPSVVLYQYAACPFCNKVRAYLDFAKVPYVVVEVDPLLKRELSWSKDYQKVPIAIVDGKAVRDSSVIINTVDALLRPRAGGAALPPSLPHAQVSTGTPAEVQWRGWVDAVLVKHLTINIYRTWGEALSTFDYLTARNFPAWSALASKYVGGGAMVMVARKRAKELAVPTGKEREHLYTVLNTWAEAVGEGPFLGGATPDLADVSVFGAMRSIEGLPTMQDALVHSKVGPWYERMRGAVGAPALLHSVGEAPAVMA